ncbi:hypothetical protein AMECASPLE_001531 [Ameca splendens]|uniref:Uncharacterized protein n=1 Tax=Ameca splendens TaxID=208324 RepID=A0ABV0ZHT7_9TELE
MMQLFIGSERLLKVKERSGKMTSMCRVQGCLPHSVFHVSQLVELSVCVDNKTVHYHSHMCESTVLIWLLSDISRPSSLFLSSSFDLMSVLAKLPFLVRSDTLKKYLF